MNFNTKKQLTEYINFLPKKAKKLDDFLFKISEKSFKNFSH